MYSRYYKIFTELIGQHLRDTLIYRYSSVKKNHEYRPFYHNHDANTEESIAQLMRRYIYMYAYSEREVVEDFERGKLRDLEVAAKRALRERLPQREGATNGLYSELLLDLIITLYVDHANKLATRAIYRQMTDNQEIKGFDGLHVLMSPGGKELWLGQAKMGSLSYCTRSIIDDLRNKANMLYTSEQLYFVSDKERAALDDALTLLKKINDVSWSAEGLSAEERASKLTDFFKSEDIKIIFPCLLAYSSPGTYEVKEDIENEIKLQLNKMVEKFDEDFKGLITVPYEIIILFIPIRDLDTIRNKMVEEI